MAAALGLAIGGAARSGSDALLLVPEGTRYSHLDRMRHAPPTTRVSAPALIGVLQRHHELHELGIGMLDLTLPPGRSGSRRR